MRVRLFLLVTLITLSLPCLELPELAGMCDDASNDFLVMPSRAEGLACASAVWKPHFADARSNPDGLFIAFASSFPSAPIPHVTRSVLSLISVQKK